MRVTDVTAIVLAGGGSSRMWPLGDKHMLTFAGRRLAELHVANLRAVGIESFVFVCTNENLGMFQELVKSLGVGGTTFVQSKSLGMAGAVLEALERDDRAPELPVYVTQPHDVVQRRLHEEILKAATLGSSYAYVAGHASNQHLAGGYFILRDGRPVGIVEKPAEGSEPSNIVTIVAHLFSDKQLLAGELEHQLQNKGSDDAYERALDTLMAQRDFSLVRYDEEWQALKYPWHVLDVTTALLEQIKRGELDLGPRYTKIEPGVFVGENFTIFPGAHLAPPVVLGHDVVVGHNALVRESVVGDRCVIGFASEVARSYLADGCQLHANYVGDSVLDTGVLLGFGSVSANFRLDERAVGSVVSGERVDSRRAKLGMIVGKEAKLGVGVNVMPGVKVGRRAIIGPGQVVARDVADGERLIGGSSG